MAYKRFATILTIAITIACQHGYCHAAPQQRINVSITVPSTKEFAYFGPVSPNECRILNVQICDVTETMGCRRLNSFILLISGKVEAKALGIPYVML